jgi:hypothetical protein
MVKKGMPEPIGEMWRQIADDFYSMWQFPNCIGAIDGKHFEIQAPKNSQLDVVRRGRTLMENDY